MPELPEVETIRRGLASKILGIPITAIEVRKPKMVGGDVADFTQTLQNNAITQLNRQGKLLYATLQTGERSLTIHLKMTGQLIYRHGDEQVAGGHPWPDYNGALPNQYTHVQLAFADGGRLFFNDQRQFGYWKLVAARELATALGRYGIEPLTPDFTLENFRRELARGSRQTPLKAILLNQERFSGIGNIYADEICFHAHVRPDRPVGSLTDVEQLALYEAAQAIIAHAIEQRGTTISDYKDHEGKRGNYSDFLMVYQRGGLPCLRCGSTIVRTKLAGRGTHFCPSCQV